MQGVIDFLVAHKDVELALLVAIIDFAIGVNPKLASNSIIEAVLSFLKKKPVA